MPYLPVGGATTAFQSPDLLMFGFVDRNQTAKSIVPIPLGELTVDSDSPFLLPNVQAEADWVAILSSPVGSISSRFDVYHVTYALESKTYPNEFTGYGQRYPSPLLASANEQRYITYEDTDSVLIYIGG